MKTAPFALAMLALVGGCASTPPPPSGDGIARARLGETVRVDGPKVTPLAVIEDSRCPADVQCVWAGRVRISARIDLSSGSQTRELTLGQPQQVADGSLTLVEATPTKRSRETIEPGDYRFGFRFMGGI
jgi:hypothetical protein